MMTTNSLEYNRKYRAEHRDRINEQHRISQRKHLETHRKGSRKWRQNHPEYQRKHLEKHRKGSVKYRKNNPEKIYAQNIAYKHIPLGSECQFGSCHSNSRLERAHLDYNEPLEVLTFCIKHHHLIDRLYRRFD